MTILEYRLPDPIEREAKVSCSHWGMFDTRALDFSPMRYDCRITVNGPINIRAGADKDEIGRTVYQAARLAAKQLGKV